MYMKALYKASIMRHREPFCFQHPRPFFTRRRPFRTRPQTSATWLCPLLSAAASSHGLHTAVSCGLPLPWTQMPCLTFEYSCECEVNQRAATAIMACSRPVSHSHFELNRQASVQRRGEISDPAENSRESAPFDGAVDSSPRRLLRCIDRLLIFHCSMGPHLGLMAWRQAEELRVQAVFTQLKGLI